MKSVVKKTTKIVLLVWAKVRNWITWHELGQGIKAEF